jgi:serine/threonine-protein kinase RsbW
LGLGRGGWWAGLVTERGAGCFSGGWAGKQRTVSAKPVPDVMFCLAFGCEELSVPVMRQVLGDTLRGLGVAEESVYDLLLAATEACTNVLMHGRPAAYLAGGRAGAGYAVVTSLSGTGCLVEVTGPGCRRRSLAVARACVDNVTLRRRPGRGAVVTMSKHIVWSWDAPLRRLAVAN